MEIFGLPYLVHDLNDVCILVETVLSTFEDLINVNHPLMI